MKCTEINPIGNFDPWEHTVLQELKRNQISDCLGQTLLFENDNIRVWEVVLFPGERLPFRKIGNNYNLSSMTDGLALSRHANGRVSLIRIRKRDAIFLEHEGNESICDFENIGENILFLHAMEFKPLVNQTDGLNIPSLK